MRFKAVVVALAIAAGSFLLCGKSTQAEVDPYYYSYLSSMVDLGGGVYYYPGRMGTEGLRDTLRELRHKHPKVIVMKVEIGRQEVTDYTTWSYQITIRTKMKPDPAPQPTSEPCRP